MLEKLNLPEDIKNNDPVCEVKPAVMQIARIDFKTVASYEEIELFVKNPEHKILPSIFIILSGDTVSGITFTSKMFKDTQNKVDFLCGILDTLDSGIVAVDENEIIQVINQKFYNIHSLDHNIEGESIYRRLPETLISIPLKKPDESPFSGPIKFSKSGTTVVPTYKPVKNPKGDLLGAVAIVKEYIDNQNMGINTNEVTSLAHLFSGIFSNISDIVFCLDVNQYI